MERHQSRAAATPTPAIVCIDCGWRARGRGARLNGPCPECLARRARARSTALTIGPPQRASSLSSTRCARLPASVTATCAGRRAALRPQAGRRAGQRRVRAHATPGSTAAGAHGQPMTLHRQRPFMSSTLTTTCARVRAAPRRRAARASELLGHALPWRVRDCWRAGKALLLAALFGTQPFRLQ
jgi:hypothetical protein